MIIPVLAVPFLVMVTAGVFVHGGLVRLRSLRGKPPAERAAGMLWACVGFAIGGAVVAGAAMMFLEWQTQPARKGA